MKQELALEIMLAGESVLLTGPAGSGKTYLLSQFIKLAKKEGKSVAVTATTGLAASHLGGSTIHAWSGIGINDSLPYGFLSNLTKTRRDIIENTDVLIIDEISMLHDYRLDLVDQVARLVRENDAPFGGLQVVLCGDFFQLPPVNRDADGGNFVISSQAWAELDPVICYLEEQHRQDDDAFLQILNALRAGDIRRHHAEALLARIDAPLSGQATELHTTNVDVDEINARELAAMPGEPHAFTMTTTGKANYVDSLKRSCLAVEELTLKIGALVMCIKNSPDRKYVNGSLGIVTGFEEDTDFPIVRLHSGRELTITPESWELRDGEKKRASLAQVPLRLAWAITIHKSQGMTLDAARIDLRRAFVPGMGYVALSRVRRLETLSLAGINKTALSVSAEALRIHEHLKLKASQDKENFKHLEKAAAKRQKSLEKNKDKPEKNSGWHDKITEMRKTFPNAFMPWKEDDDKKLISLFLLGTGLDELCTALGRQPGSIEARLKKHYGEEVAIPK